MKVTIKKDSPLKLIQHRFNLEEKCVWDGNSDKGNLFLHVYIKQKYAKKLHLLDYTEIVLYSSYDKNNRTIYKAALADYSKSNRHIDLDVRKELEPYIVKYRNTSKRYTFFNASVYEGTLYDKEGHSFFFIYDKKNNTVTLFDSAMRYWFDNQKKFFYNFFKWIYSDNVKISFEYDGYFLPLKNIYYLRCWQYGKKVSVTYTVKDYSVIWVLWCLEMILTNPKLTIDELKLKIEILLFDAKDLICKIAAGYARFIDKTISKYKIIYPKRKITQK